MAPFDTVVCEPDISSPEHWAVLGLTLDHEVFQGAAAVIAHSRGLWRLRSCDRRTIASDSLLHRSAENEIFDCVASFARASVRPPLRFKLFDLTGSETRDGLQSDAN